MICLAFLLLLLFLFLFLFLLVEEEDVHSGAFLDFVVVSKVGRTSFRACVSVCVSVCVCVALLFPYAKIF